LPSFSQEVRGQRPRGWLAHALLKGAAVKLRPLVLTMLLGSLPQSPAARAQGPCTAERVADLLMHLFPPAPLDARTENARPLAQCRLPGTVGALTAALAHDPEVPVRIEAASALGLIGTRPALEALQATLSREQPLALRRHTVRVLV